jgi:hypothetical protein
VSRIFIRLNGLPGPNAARAPLLERVLARAGWRDAAPDWREQAYQLLAPTASGMPGIAAAALCAELGPVDGGAAFVASPVHCEAGMVSVRLPADGLIRLERSEAAHLAQEFNRDFSDGAQRLIAAPSGRLYCVLAAPTAATTRDPLAVCGRDIGPLLPAGPDGARLRRLMSEIEMWLYEHALNRARVANGSLPITGLWLWGGGAPLATLPQLRGWTGGSDVLFGAWPALPEFPREPRPGVVVLDAEPGSEPWRGAQEAWLAPALRALRAGRIRQLQIGIGGQTHALRAGWSLRLWRRIRPWWEYLQ